MGNDPPQNVSQPSQQAALVKTVSSSEDDEDIYILENLTNIALKGQRKQKYFWVDPKIFNGENQKYLNFLEKNVDIEGYSSVTDGLMKELSNIELNHKVKVVCAASLKDEEYKILQNDSRIAAVFLFCQNQQRAKLLMSNFPKIKSAKFDIRELRDFLSQQQTSADGLDPRTNVLVMFEDDTNLMNKYRINFHSLTNSKSKTKAKADFVNFAKKFYPDMIAEINEFEQNYKLNLPSGQNHRQAIFWLGREGFFWESTQTLPKITTDPKKLAYLRFPFKQGYQGILKEYKSKPLHLSQVYMVFTPTNEELDKLKQNLSNFVIFTTFAKGYTVEKQAKAALKKNLRSYLIRVMMKLPPKIEESLDFGYQVLDIDNKSGVQARPDVIFNIYNVFQVVQFEQDLKEFTFQYGSLAEVAYIREFARTTRLSPFQQNLLRNYDYLQDIISRIDSQATILQMSGHFEDSLRIYNQKLQQVRKSQPSQQVLDRCSIQLGDAYRINEEYKKAEQQFLSIKQGKMALIAHVHLAELYFKSKQTDKLQKIISQIEKNLSQYKNISQPDSFKAQNYIGMDLMNRGMYKQASKLYKSLAKQINAYYDFKFEGIPLVHEICRNRAACETKLNNYTQALNLLDSTKGWQKVCEGNKSPGLAITQNLIKSVYQSKGNAKQAQQCEMQIKKIQQSAPKDENLYLSRSGVFVNLNESVINIQTSNTSSAPFKADPPARLIQQSALNIDLDL